MIPGRHEDKNVPREADRWSPYHRRHDGAGPEVRVDRDAGPAARWVASAVGGAWWERTCDHQIKGDILPPPVENRREAWSNKPFARATHEAPWSSPLGGVKKQGKRRRRRRFTTHENTERSIGLHDKRSRVQTTTPPGAEDPLHGGRVVRGAAVARRGEKREARGSRRRHHRRRHHRRRHRRHRHLALTHLSGNSIGNKAFCCDSVFLEISVERKYSK